MPVNRLKMWSERKTAEKGRVAAAVGLAAMLLTAGCRQDMQNQPKLIPQRGSALFADQRGARPPGDEHGGAWTVA